jgi:hypothetical protein
MISLLGPLGNHLIGSTMIEYKDESNDSKTLVTSQSSGNSLISLIR